MIARDKALAEDKKLAAKNKALAKKAAAALVVNSGKGAAKDKGKVLAEGKKKGTSTGSAKENGTLLPTKRERPGSLEPDAKIGPPPPPCKKPTAYGGGMIYVDGNRVRAYTRKGDASCEARRCQSFGYRNDASFKVAWYKAAEAIKNDKRPRV